MAFAAPPWYRGASKRERSRAYDHRTTNRAEEEGAGPFTEQLGAQLGVSRQAIYKWESDAALPEIEKLVTLSRRFSVSVGWLLGEETDTPEGADAGTPADDEGELTEAQLRMVEELVRRYQAAQPKRAAGQAVLGCVLACALLLYLFGQLRSVRQDYQNLQQALNNVNYSVGSQIGTISDQVRSLLEQHGEHHTLREHGHAAVRRLCRRDGDVARSAPRRRPTSPTA